MRPAMALLALAALLLAGCTAGTGNPPSPADDPSLGILAGVVVDEAVRPVQGASVDIQAQNRTLNATTDQDGRFQVVGLEPGTYLVRVSKAFYSEHQQAVTVVAGFGEPELVQFQLVFEPRSVPYVQLYKFEGLFECGVWPTNGCANVNILTGIVLCSLDLPCFNVTGDRSVELHPIDGVPTFLQSEMTWEPTTATGESLQFGIGHATREELQDGFADGDNFTEGHSPLMLTINGTTLSEAGIGGERMLLIQVSTGATIESPQCAPEIGLPPPCGAGVALEQSYTTYTHAFYGYTPPPGWLFTSGEPVPLPPA